MNLDHILLLIMPYMQKTSACPVTGQPCEDDCPCLLASEGAAIAIVAANAAPARA